MTITAQLPDLFPDADEETPLSLAAQFLDLSDSGPVPGRDPGPAPDDKTAISMFSAHRLDGTLRELSHASQRMQAARAAPTGDLRAYHSRHVFYHLQRALQAGHELTANIRAHYPAEAAELEQVKQAVGLAKSLTPGMKAATTAHLLETTLHEETHGVRHAKALPETEPGDVWEFNADHCEKHLGGAVEHAGKLARHFADNYPDVARWLDGLEEITSRGEEPDSRQHARYAKRKDATVSAQMAAPVTVSGQVADLAGGDAVKVSMDVTGPADQVAPFVQLCKTIQALCQVGASRTVQVDVDGDGNASLSFTFGSLGDAADVKPASFDSDPVRLPGIGG